MTDRPGGALAEAEAYLAERVRRPYPEASHVVRGSTPVVSFGDVRTAWVATLALNPSSSEFLDASGALLTGAKQRFETLDSLGVDSLTGADDHAVRRVLDACYQYFNGPNPYWKWFRPLERLLAEALGASYRDGTAAHLDLVQWATDPVWGQIGDEDVRRRLIAADRTFLAEQLAAEQIRLVLANGRTATDQLGPLGVEFEPLDVTYRSGSGFHVRRGLLGETLVIGWNRPFPNGGISRTQRDALVEVIREQAATLRPRRQQEGSMGIARNTHVASKTELAKVLRDWLATGEKTIGDTSVYGGKPWIRIGTGDLEVVLNADTKRTAVQEYLDHATAHGDDVPWTVVANTKGTINKVIYRVDGAAATGWYAYTSQPQKPGTRI